jgi:hypothetical protein
MHHVVLSLNSLFCRASKEQWKIALRFIRQHGNTHMYVSLLVELGGYGCFHSGDRIYLRFVAYRAPRRIFVYRFFDNGNINLCTERTTPASYST